MLHISLAIVVLRVLSVSLHIALYCLTFWLRNREMNKDSNGVSNRVAITVGLSFALMKYSAFLGPPTVAELIKSTGSLKST